MLDRAQVILIMDEQQRRSLRRRFNDHPGTRLVDLPRHPGRFGFMQPELVALLQIRAAPRLRYGEGLAAGLPLTDRPPI
jgi:predicted protein tyrosine phosphatase